MGIYSHLCFIFLSAFFPTKVWGKYCDGGHFCTPPKECCSQGCCYVYTPPGQRPPPATDPSLSVLKWVITEHWYFWASALVCVVVLCSCSLWNRRGALIARFCGRQRVAGALSDRDSAGSCYLPPQYSRCSSFHHAPPPYTEVTTKPDLYPLVITYGDNADKGGASYLMVHYFRNYIIRPSGSLSATSTTDSLSSSFICNASNEANTIIPPPYSSTGNFEECRNGISAASAHRQTMLRSVSSLTCPPQTATPHSRIAMRQSASTHFRTVNPSLDSSDCNSDCSFQTTAIRSPSRAQSEESDMFYPEPHNSDRLSPQAAAGNIHSSDPRVTPRRSASSYVERSMGSDSVGNPSLQFFFRDNNLNSNTGSNRKKAPPNSLMRDNQVHNNNFTRKLIARKDFWEDFQGELNEFNNFGNDRPTRDESFPRANNNPAQNVRCKEDNNSFKAKAFSKSNFHRQYDLESPISNEALPNPLCQIGGSINVDYNNYRSSIDTGSRHCNSFNIHPDLEELRTSYISITGSDVSSLVNISTPNSPPRATSPTMGKDFPNVRQLPMEDMSTPKKQSVSISEASNNNESDAPKSRRFFGRGRKSSLYMPLSLTSNPKMFLPGKVSPTSNVLGGRCSAPRRGWLSRSAPTTPSGNVMVPSLLAISHRKPSSSGSTKNNPEEGSPLLSEPDNTDDQQNVEF